MPNLLLMASLEEAVAQVGVVAVEAAKQGRLDIALETIFGVLREVSHGITF